MKTTIKILITLIMLGGFSSAFAKKGNDNGNGNGKGNGGHHSQAGGLPALADEVAELRAMLEDLQGQIGDDSDPYAGRYAINLVEWSFFGCGTTTDPFTAVAANNLLGYLQNQGISNAVTRSASFEVDSDGMQMTMPQYTLLSQELRLSGMYEEDTRIEGGYTVVIAADGSLSIPEATADVSGQISADGSVFSLLVKESFDEENCKDSYSVLVTGIRK